MRPKSKISKLLLGGSKGSIFIPPGDSHTPSPFEDAPRMTKGVYKLQICPYPQYLMMFRVLKFDILRPMLDPARVIFDILRPMLDPARVIFFRSNLRYLVLNHVL